MDINKRRYNAVKYLYREIYELDKDFNFKFPTKKTDLSPYALRMRNIIEMALDIGGVSRVIGHELEDFKREDDEGE